MSKFPLATLLKKIPVPHPSHYLPTDAQGGVKPHEPLLHDRSLTGLVLCWTCVDDHSCCEFQSELHVIQEGRPPTDSLLLQLQYSAFFSSFSPSTGNGTVVNRMCHCAQLHSQFLRSPPKQFKMKICLYPTWVERGH